MRHHKAAQHGEGGPWHYVSLGRDGGHPIGYCTDACTHATAEEAAEHYRQWLLDGFRFDGSSGDSVQYRCEVPVPTGSVNISGMLTAPPTDTKVCGTWTQRLAMGPDGWIIHHVCHGHSNRESMELLHPEGSIGESWES